MFPRAATADGEMVTVEVTTVVVHPLAGVTLNLDRGKIGVRILESNDIGSMVALLVLFCPFFLGERALEVIGALWRHLDLRSNSWVVLGLIVP